MVRNILMCLAVVGLAACEDGGGFSPITGDRFGEDDGPENGSIPPGQVDTSQSVVNGTDICSQAAGACQGDLVLVQFDVNNPDQLIIRGLPFDSEQLDAVYLDSEVNLLTGVIGDFSPVDTFNNTGTRVSSEYVAVYVRNENVGAGAVKAAEYGDFGYGGAFFQVNTPVVEVPTSENLAAYTGEYAGLRAFNGQRGLTVVEGTLFLQLDNNPILGGTNPLEPRVNGTIVRTAVGTVGGSPDDDLSQPNLNTIILGDAPLVAGTFNGTASVQFDQDNDGAPDLVQSGTYSGTFGGASANSVAGVVVMEGDLTQELPVDLTEIGVQETGIFIGDREP